MITPDTDQLPGLARLATLVREVCEMQQHRDTAAYAGYIAELAALHDEVSKHPRDSVEHRQTYTEAVKVFKAARMFATRYNLPHPNEVLRDLGYHPV